MPFRGNDRVISQRRPAPIRTVPMFESVVSGIAEVDAAYEAFVALGKGNGYGALLNFGDVFSHELAKTRSLPL